MKEITASQFTQTVRFLGGVLGPDYEVALYDLEAEGCPVIAIANGRITGQTIGSPLPDALRAGLSAGTPEGDFSLHAAGQLQVSGKTIRSSTLVIRDEGGKAVGLLGVNFDDSRYLALCHSLLELIHPDQFVRQQYEQLGQPGPAEEEISPVRSGGPVLHNDVSSLIQEIFSETVAHWPIPLDRLTQEERVEIIAQLRQRGMFRLKGAVQYAAEGLHCSPASIYRYLGKARQGEPES